MNISAHRLSLILSLDYGIKTGCFYEHSEEEDGAIELQNGWSVQIMEYGCSLVHEVYSGIFDFHEQVYTTVPALAWAIKSKVRN